MSPKKCVNCDLLYPIVADSSTSQQCLCQTCTCKHACVLQQWAWLRPFAAHSARMDKEHHASSVSTSLEEGEVWPEMFVLRSSAAAALPRRARGGGGVVLAAAVSLLLLGACIRQTASMECGARDTALSLDDAIHLSDVVVTGRVISVRKGENGISKVNISFYYAYKRDNRLQRQAFSMMQAAAGFDPQERMDGTGFFFLVREPSGDLVLQCVGTLEALEEALRTRSSSVEADSPVALLDHVNEVAKSEFKLAFS